MLGTPCRITQPPAATEIEDGRKVGQCGGETGIFADELAVNVGHNELADVSNICVVDGDYIAVHFTVTGTHRGAFQGIEATGRRVTTPEFTLYRLEDGKFAEVWDHADMNAVMMSQIGQDEAQAPFTAPADAAATADS